MTTPFYRGRSREVHRRAVAAVAALKGQPVYGRRDPALADLVDSGLVRELEHLEAVHNSGKKFVAGARARRISRGHKPRNL